jgi:outer membrane lipoprotein SlyB
VSGASDADNTFNGNYILNPEQPRSAWRLVSPPPPDRHVQSGEQTGHCGIFAPLTPNGVFKMSTKSAPWLTCLALLAGCAGTTPFTDSGVNSLIDIQYGTIEQVQEVQLKANYGSGVLLGGGIGALATMHYSAGTQALAAVGGALLGALVAKERAGTAEQYTIHLVNGNTVSIVSEAHNLVAGDCVAVEQGKHANLRRVDPQMCNTPSPEATYPQAHAAEQQSAVDCDTAKQDMLKASTEQEATVDYQKMKALCSN